MFANLAGKLEGKTVILDNSVITHDISTGRGINEELYEGIAGLKRINFQNISDALASLNSLTSALRGARVITLPETIQEASVGLKYLNGHIAFISQRKKPGIRKKAKRKRWDDETDEDDYRLELIKQYADAIYAHVHSFKPFNPKENGLGDYFDRFYAIAEARSKDLDARAKEDKRKFLENPAFLGDKLRTDQKIAATAYALGYKGPCYVLSADNGLVTLLTRINETIRNPSRAHFYGISNLPNHPIEFIHPDTFIFPIARKPVVYSPSNQ
jgi:hypothetical protein